MDDLKKKLGGLFNGRGFNAKVPSLTGGRKWQGQGHKLGQGGGESSSGNHPAQRQKQHSQVSPSKDSSASSRPQATPMAPQQLSPTQTTVVSPPAGEARGYQPPPALSEEAHMAIGMLLSAETGSLAAATLRKVRYPLAFT